MAVIYNCWATVFTEDERSEYEWGVAGYISHYVPARTSGPPELCYPEEGGELEAVRVELSAVDGKRPLYYHHCHAPRPNPTLVEYKLFEALDEEYDGQL